MSKPEGPRLLSSNRSSISCVATLPSVFATETLCSMSIRAAEVHFICACASAYISTFPALPLHPWVMAAHQANWVLLPLVPPPPVECPGGLHCRDKIMPLPLLTSAHWIDCKTSSSFLQTGQVLVNIGFTFRLAALVLVTGWVGRVSILA